MFVLFWFLCVSCLHPRLGTTSHVSTAPLYPPHSPHSLRPLFRLPLHSSRSTPGQRTAAFPCFSFGFVVAASVFHLTPLIPFVSFISFVGLLNLDPPRHPPSRRSGIHVASIFAGKVNNDERCKHDEDL